MKKNRVGKILGQNFIFGLKKSGLGKSAYAGRYLFKIPAAVVSM
jgi:hypothetical protein